jgi:hypothetical protein
LSPAAPAAVGVRSIQRIAAGDRIRSHRRDAIVGLRTLLVLDLRKLIVSKPKSRSRSVQVSHSIPPSSDNTLRSFMR